MTFTEILLYFRDSIRAYSNKHLNFSENSFIYSLGQAVATLGVKIYAAMNNIETRTSILTATDEDLDNIFANFKIQRKTAQSAVGYINIWMNSLPESPITIISGEEFYDSEGRRFRTIESAVIPSNVNYYPTSVSNLSSSRFYALPQKDSSIDYTETGTTEAIKQFFIPTNQIRIEAVVEGLDGNVAKNTITSSRGGVIVNNPVPTTGGTEQEDDERFRLRGISFIRGANSKFSKNSLKAFLLDIDGVIDANVIEDYNCLSFTPPRSGHIYAIVNTSMVPITSDTSEPYPTDIPRNIYQEIRNKIEDEMYRPLGIGITVREADVLNVNFTSDTYDALKVYVKSDVIASVKETEIKSAIYNYFLNVDIGQDIYKTDIYSVLKEDPDVVNIIDFDFESIYGTSTSGSSQYTEVSSLQASCNQVYRVSSSSSLKVSVENIDEDSC